MHSSSPDSEKCGKKSDGSRAMIHEDFAFLDPLIMDPLIEKQQWCTRGLAKEDYSVL